MFPRFQKRYLEDGTDERPSSNERRPALYRSRGVLPPEFNHQVELVRHGVAEEHLPFRERRTFRRRRQNESRLSQSHADRIGSKSGTKQLFYTSWQLYLFKEKSETNAPRPSAHPTQGGKCSARMVLTSGHGIAIASLLYTE